MTTTRALGILVAAAVISSTPGFTPSAQASARSEWRALRKLSKQAAKEYREEKRKRQTGILTALGVAALTYSAAALTTVVLPGSDPVIKTWGALSGTTALGTGFGLTEGARWRRAQARGLILWRALNGRYGERVQRFARSKEGIFRGSGLIDIVSE